MNKDQLVYQIRAELRNVVWYDEKEPLLNALSKIQFLVDTAIQELIHQEEK